jgi:hypothetical protein
MWNTIPFVGTGAGTGDGEHARNIRPMTSEAEISEETAVIMMMPRRRRNSSESLGTFPANPAATFKYGYGRMPALGVPARTPCRAFGRR